MVTKTVTTKTNSPLSRGVRSSHRVTGNPSTILARHLGTARHCQLPELDVSPVRFWSPAPLGVPRFSTDSRFPFAEQLGSRSVHSQDALPPQLWTRGERRTALRVRSRGRASPLATGRRSGRSPASGGWSSAARSFPGLDDSLTQQLPDLDGRPVRSPSHGENLTDVRVLAVDGVIELARQNRRDLGPNRRRRMRPCWSTA